MPKRPPLVIRFSCILDCLDDDSLLLFSMLSILTVVSDQTLRRSTTLAQSLRTEKKSLRAELCSSELQKKVLEVAGL